MTQCGVVLLVLLHVVFLVPSLDQPVWFLFARPEAGPMYKTLQEKERWGAASQTVNRVPELAPL
jgi:hypothetical protein